MKGFLISDIHADHIGNGNPSKAKILRYLEKHLCPADVLFIAGDISDSATAFATTIDALCGLYSKVVYCFGNHDMTVHKSVNESSHQKTLRAVNKISSTNSLRMNGNFIDLTESTRLGGTIGAYDFSYANKHFGLSFECMMNRWKDWYDGRHWKLDNMTYADFLKDETNKMNTLVFNEQCNLMMTHFGPFAYNIPSRFHNPETGFFYFDGLKYLDSMPNGSIWLYGHTHTKKILDLGNIRLMCNPIGYPGELTNDDGTFDKTEFLFDIR